MTYRLDVLDSDGTRHVIECDTYPEIIQKMMGQVPWHDQPQAVTIHRLGPFEPTTWSQVAEGDEVHAPNNTVWVVEDTAAVGGITAYRIRNTLTGDETVTRPQPQLEVRRRRGPATEVRQMLLDAGIETTIVRQKS